METMETEGETTVTTNTHAPPSTTTSQPVALSISAAPRFTNIGCDVLEQQATLHLPSNRSASAVAANGGAKMMTSTEICVSLQAQDMPEEDDDDTRAPVDIVVVLDRSSSMNSRQKFKLCQKTLKLLLRQLRPQDRFGLITYSSDARVEVPIQKMTPQHRQTASSIISRLSPRGGTNMSSGVVLAAREMVTTLQQEGGSNPVQTVFFLTDGHANQGICTVDGLKSLVKDSFNTVNDQLATSMSSLDVSSQPSNQNKSISLHTFGYGTDHNGGLLSEMASATEGGSYYFMEEDMDVGIAFGEALGGVLSVVAQTAIVTLQVPSNLRAERGVEIVQVHHDNVVCRQPGSSYTVNMGDFYADEARDLIVTVRLASPLDNNSSIDHYSPIPHLTASLAYTDTVEARMVEGDCVTVSIARPRGSNTISDENTHVAAHVFRVHAAQEMQQAERLAAAGQFQQAKSTFTSIKEAYHNHCSAAVQTTALASDLLDDAMEMESCMDNAALYRTKGQATLNSKLRCHKLQRASMPFSTAAVTKAPEQASATWPAPNTTTSSTTTVKASVYKRSKKRANVASKFAGNQTKEG